METGSKKLVILSYAIVRFHPSVSLNNEKNCCAISEDKIAVCAEKTAGLRSGNFSNLNSACQKVVVPVKIFQFQDMLNENRFLDTFRGHSKRTIRCEFAYRFKHGVIRNGRQYYAILLIANCASMVGHLQLAFVVGSKSKSTDIFNIILDWI